jgi:hypothetical protein
VRVLPSAAGAGVEGEMIYAIRAVGTNLIKFGKAKNPESRIAVLQTGCPVDLALIAIAEWPDKEEGKIHIYLAGDHARGEWFRDGDRAQRLLDCMRDRAYGMERWHMVKRKNGVQSRREPLESPKAEIPKMLPFSDAPKNRLGRILRYAEQLTSDNPNSTPSAA